MHCRNSRRNSTKHKIIRVRNHLQTVKDRRVLVTGAAGFIGSNVVEFLLKDNQVIGVDNLSSGDIANVNKFKGSDNFSFLNVDVKDKTRLKKAMTDVDLIVHLSANADVRQGFSRPSVDFEENVLATKNVLDGMREKDVRELIFSSSSTVYGNASILPTPESYGPLKPISHYGASKLAAEGFIFSYSSYYGFKSSIFRFANVVGRGAGHGVIFDFMKKLRREKKTLEVLGDGRQSKSYIYIDDCIDGIFQLHGKMDGLFNLGTRESTPVVEIAKMVLDEVSPKAEIKFKAGGPGGSGWPGDVKTMTLDVSKALSAGWKYRLGSTDAVRRAVKDAVNGI